MLRWLIFNISLTKNTYKRNMNLSLQQITRYILILFIAASSQALIAQAELFLEPMEGFKSNERISDLFIDKNNTIWVASADGISTIKNADAAPDKRNAGKEPTVIKISDSGKKYIAYSDNTLTVDDALMHSAEDSDEMITDIEIHKQSVFVGTTNGLYKYDLGSNKFKKHYTTRNSQLRSNKINFIFSDSEDRLWVGTKNGILVQKKNEVDFSKNYDSKLDYIAACENQEGIWLISDQFMWLIESTDNRWVDVGLKKGLYQGEINDIAVDNDGSIYIASDILVRFDPYQNLTEQYTNILGIASKKCLSLECDKENIIWLGTSDAGLFKIYKELKNKTANEGEKTRDPEALRASIILESSISCEGQQDATVLVGVTGGTAPYSFKWSDEALVGSNPQNVGPGNYAVSITDAFGITTNADITINEANPIVIEVGEIKRVSKTLTRDGYCKINVRGGAAPYTMNWDNGENGNIARKLAFGIHTVSVVDAQGCSEQLEIEIKKPKKIADLEREKIVVGQTLRLVELFFEADSSTISINSFEVLDEVYEFLNENKDIIIEVGGHTNSIPPHEYCDQISAARAEEVAKYLYNKGIETNRIEHKGYGKRNPIASNDNASGRKKNQRVEIKILKI